MQGNTRLITLIPLALGAAAFALGAQAGGFHGKHKNDVEFDVADLYLELNDTDQDLGFHGLIDGDAWKYLRIDAPNGRSILNAWIRGALRRQGMTEFFFESAEPVLFEELDPDVFFNRFPEGEYAVEGITLEWQHIVGESELSHTLARAPKIYLNGVEISDGCDEDSDPPSLADPFEVSWSEETMSHETLGNPGETVTIEKYEFVAEIERDGDVSPETLKLVINLLPGQRSFEIPEGFLDQAGDDDEFKFEIVTRLDNGNQTSVEACFELE